MENSNLNLPQEEYEPVISQPIDMDTEIILDVFDIHGDREIKTCCGDICKIVNALRDYSRMLVIVCDTWKLQGFHRSTYEYHAEKLRGIADKFQAGIGYDYDAVLEKCRQRRSKKSRDEDVGGEAVEMALLKAERAAKTKNKQNGAIHRES